MLVGMVGRYRVEMSLKTSNFNINTPEHGKKLQLRCDLGDCFLLPLS